MNGTKHTPEQIIGKLREANAELNGGATVGKVCRKLGFGEPTCHRAREQYGGMKADAAQAAQGTREGVSGSNAR
jgi:hypothetical protein